MDVKKKWLSTVTELLKTSPLVASVGFGFIQLTLEKLVEAEFSCPCHSSHNLKYALVVFIVPTIIVFLLMCTVSYSLKLWTFKCPCKFKFICKCKCPFKCTCKSFWEALIIIIVPATTWVILVLVDGRYFACLMTDWAGKYELIENAAPQKWCKPSNSSLERNSLTKTQLWYFYSEHTGFYTALGLTVFYLVCFICSRCSSPPENERTQESGENRAVFQPLNVVAVRAEASETRVRLNPISLAYPQQGGS